MTPEQTIINVSKLLGPSRRRRQRHHQEPARGVLPPPLLPLLAMQAAERKATEEADAYLKEAFERKKGR